MNARRIQGRHRAQSVGVGAWPVPPTQYSACIGRVGALAVALGIGAAIAGSSGITVAYADPPPPSQDEGNPGGGGGVESGNADADTPADGVETPAPSSSPGPIARLFPRLRLVLPGMPVVGQLQVNNSLSRPSEGQQSSDGQQSSGGQRPTFQLPTRQRGQRLRAAEPAAAPAVEHLDAAEAPAVPRFRRAPLSMPAHSVSSAPTNLAALGRDAVASTFSALGLTHPTSAGPSASLVAPTPRLAAPTGSVLGVIARVLSGFGATPGAPNPAAPSPALWTLLGFVRREFERGLGNHSPVAAPLQTGQTTNNGVTTVTGTVGPTTDVDGDKLTYSTVPGQGPTKGSVLVNPNGTYTYTPGAEILKSGGPDTFQVAITDAPGNPPHVHGIPGLIHDVVAVTNPDLAERLYPGGGDVTYVTVTVNVTKVVPPTGMPNHLPTPGPAPTVGKPDENGVIKGSLNFTDADPTDQLKYSVVSPTTTYGTVSIDENTGEYTYTPRPAARVAVALTGGPPETDSFTVKVDDGHGTPVTATVLDVQVAEAAANSVLGVEHLADSPSEVAYSSDGKHTYLVNPGQGTITILNSDGSASTTVPVGDSPSAIAVAPGPGGNVYVANAGSHSITVITPSPSGGLPTTSTIHLGDAEPQSIVLSKNGDFLYTGNVTTTHNGDGTTTVTSNITVVSLENFEPTTIDVDPVSLAESSDGKRLYAVSAVHDQVIVVHLDQNPVTTEPIAVGSNPSDIVIDSHDEYAYVSNTGDDTVSVIRLSDNSVVKTVHVGDQPKGIAVTPDGSKVYVANYGDDSVSVIDTSDHSATATYNVTEVHVGDGPVGIAINSDGTQATVTNSLDKSATVLLLSGNDKPVVVATINAANPLTGVVTGTVAGTDADGDTLTYTLTSDATKGGLVVNPTDHTFTYTPSAATRAAASTTPGADLDSFTIAVDDNHGGVTTVSVPITIVPSSSNYYVGDPISVGQRPIGSVTTDHYTYVLNQGDNTVTVIDNATGKAVDADQSTPAVVDPLSVGSGPTWATASNGRIYVVNQGDGTISVINGASNQQADVQTIAVGSGTIGAPVVSANGSRIYVGSSTGVYVVNTADNNSVQKIATTPASSGTDFYQTGAVVSSNDGKQLYVPTLHLPLDGSNKITSTIKVIDTDPTHTATFNTVVDPDLVVGNDPAHILGNIVVAGDKLYAIDLNSPSAANPAGGPGRAYAIDIADPSSPNYGHIVGSVDVGHNPSGATVSADKKLLYVVNAGDGTVSVIDTANTAIAETVTYDSTPTPTLHSISISPDGKTAFLTSYADNTVTPIGIGAPVPYVNAAPVSTAPPTLSSPNADGVITGTVHVSDAEGNALTYSVASPNTTYGTVTVNQNTGAFTYTPDPVERVKAALSTSTVETDSFDILVSDGHNPPVAVTVSNVLVAEAPANSVIARNVQVGDAPTATAYSPDGSRLYVVNTDDDTVTVLRTSDNTPIGTPIAVGDRPVAVAVDGAGNVYVANADGHSVTTISAAGGAPTTVELVDGAGNPVQPTGIAVDNDFVYTANANSTITLIDRTTGVQNTILVDPTAIKVANGNVYAVDTEHNVISIVDSLGNPVDTVRVGDAPAGIALAQSGGHQYAFVTNSGSGTVSVIDITNGNTKLTDIAVGDQPHGIAVTPDGSKVYVANSSSNTVSVINTADYLANPVGYTPTTLDDVGQDPYDIAINPAGTQATVTNRHTDSVTVLVLSGNNKPAAVIHLDPADANGVVTGTITGADPDGDAVTLSVANSAAHGSLAFDPSDGSFTYTPDLAARHAAAGTGPVTDGFVVTIDDNHSGITNATVGVDITPQNTDPTLGQVTSLTPSNGVVVGSIVGRDEDGDTLHYSLDSGTTHGTVIVGNDGSFVYTPDDSARLAAAATTDNQFDHFTVLVDDQHGGQFVQNVSVTIASAGVVGFVSTAGQPDGGVTFSPTGTTATQVTYYRATDTDTPRSQLTIIDADTGQAIGTPINLPPADQALTPSYSKNGSYVAALVGGVDANGAQTTHLTLVDTATGTEVGHGTDIVGYTTAGGQTVFSEDGSRAFVTTMTTDDGSAAHEITHVTTINTATGAQIGQTVDVVGEAAGPLTFRPNGTTAYQSAYSNGMTHIGVIDVATGVPAGDQIDLVGGANGGVQFTPDGEKAFQTTFTATSTYVFTIDPDAGAAIGDPIDIAGFASGYPSGNILVSPTGSRAVQVTTQGSSTTVTVINTTTSEVVDTTTLTGTQSGNVTFADGGNKAIVVMKTAGSGNIGGDPGGDTGGSAGHGGDGGGASGASAFGGTSTVTIIDLNTGATLGTVTVAGSSPAPITVSPNGKKAVMVTGSGTSSVVTVIDVTTGGAVGTTPTPISGQASGVLFDRDGNRAFVTVGGGGTSVAVIDTATGAKVGNIDLSNEGVPIGGLQRGPDDTRAFQTVNVSGTDGGVTRLVVVDLGSATATGDVVAVDGYSYSSEGVKFSPDGGRAFVTTVRGGPDIGSFYTVVTDIDPAPFFEHNVAPVATSAPTFSSPNPDGVITGTVHVVDPDQDTLTYTVVSPTTTYGTVEVDEHTGAFIYTPDPVERVKASLSTSNVETDSFDVIVSDGHNPPVTVTVSNVLVAETPANSVIARDVAVGQAPTATAYSPDGTRVYVVNTDDGTVTVLRTSDNTPIGTPIPVGDRPVAVAVASDGTVYVANADGHSVTSISAAGVPTTVMLVDGAGIPVAPSGIAVDDTFVYTANANSTITLIDRATGVQRTIAVDPASIGLANGNVYAVDTDHNVVAIVDGGGHLIGTVPVGDTPAGIAVAQSGGHQYAFVTNSGSGTVSVIDITNGNTKLTDIQVGDQPHGIAVTPDGSKVYVVNTASNTVSVINTADYVANPTGYTPLTVDDVGQDPFDIAINSAGTQATITNRVTNSVTVLVLSGNQKPVAIIHLNPANPHTGVVTGSVAGTDPDGDPVTISSSTHPRYGSLDFNPSDGTFTYTPDPPVLGGIDDPNLAENFDFTIDDNRGGLTYALVAFVVNPPARNQNPSLRPESDMPSNGVVVGNVNGTDPEGDRLSYNVTVQPTLGTLDFHQDGSYNYTPYASSRTAAAANGPDTDHFTVTASDGYGGTVTKVVNVMIAPTGVLGSTTVPGSPVLVVTNDGTRGGALVSPDGSRAILVTAANPDGTQRQAVVIDTNTGVQLGSAISLPDSSSQPTVLYNASGSRAAVVVQTEGDTGVTSHVKLINTASGQQIGTTIDLAGAPGNVGTQFNSAGDRLVMTAIVPSDPDSPGTSAQTHVVTLNAVTGAEINNITVDGAVIGATFSPNQPLDYLTVATFGSDGNPYEDATTRLVKINTNTGAQAGDIAVGAGMADGGAVLSPDGTRILQTTSTTTGSSTTTHVYTINAQTGAVIGAPADVAGLGQGSVVLMADGTRAVQIASDNSTPDVTANFVVLDTTTGRPVANPVSLSGSVSGKPVISPDGSQFVITTAVSDSTTGTTTSYRLYDATTGAQVGDQPLEVHDTVVGSPVYSPDGTRLIVIANTPNPASTYGNDGLVYVVDTTAGGEADPIRVGDSVPLDSSVFFTSDGRALFTVVDVAPGTTFGYGTRVVALDLNDGTTTKSALIDGQASAGIVGAPSGNKVMQAVYTFDYTTSHLVGRVVVVDIGGAVPTETNSIDVTGIPVVVTLTPDRTRTLVNQAATSTLGGPQQTTTVTVLDSSAFIDNPNTDPTITGAPSVATPFGSDGAVTGAVHVTDRDGDALSYSVSDATKGTVVIDPGTGHFTYIPFVAERAAAGASAGPDTDSFTVTIDDGFSTPTEIPVTVTIAPTGVIGMPTIVGVPDQVITGDDVTPAAVVSPDGSRAILIVTTNPDATHRQAIVVDTATGAQVGSAIPLPDSSNQSTLSYNADGSRAVVVMQTEGDDPNVVTSHVVLIDTVTGQQVGNTVDLDGFPGDSGTKFNAAGDRLVLTAIQLSDPSSPGSAQTKVVTLDAVSGDEIGTTTVDGAVTASMTFSPDEPRGYLTVTSFGSGPDPYSAASTRLVKINTDTGAQEGDIVVGSGLGTGGVVLSPDGTRMFQSTVSTDTGGVSTTHVYTINAATGAVIGAPVDVDGQASGSVVLLADGTRALQVAIADSPYLTTNFVVIDTATGLAVGDSGSVPGYQFEGRSVVSPDGSQFVLTTVQGTDRTLRIYDAATAEEVGDPIAVGYLYSPTYSPDGTRLVVVASEYRGPGDSDALVNIYDTATATRVGDQLTVDGGVDRSVFFTSDGRVLLTAASTATGSSNDYATRVVAIDLSDGTKVESASVAGIPVGGLVGAPSGDRLLQTVYTYDASNSFVTRVLVVDVSDGVPTIGNAFDVEGIPSRGVTLTPDRTRALVTAAWSSGLSGRGTTSVTVIDAAAFIDNPNNSPIATATPSVGSPVGLYSAVSGTVHFADPDGDALSYSASIAPKGTVVIDPATGHFTFTPSAQASSAAAATPGIDTDVFTVTVSDGRGGSATSNVTVEVAPPSPYATTTVSGAPDSSPVVSPDGSKAIQLVDVTNSQGVHTRRAIVLDTATGAQVGNAITVESSSNPARVVFSADGSSAAIVVDHGDPVPANRKSLITVIDTATGAQVGDTIAADGDLLYGDAAVQYSPDGERLVVSSYTETAQGIKLAAIYTIVDAHTGERVGDQIAVAGEPNAYVTISPDGSRGYVSVISPDDPSGVGLYSTDVAILDLKNGGQVGSIELGDGVSAGNVLSSDGSRLYVTILTFGTGGASNTTHVVTVDTAQQQVINSSIVIPGNPATSTLLADDTRVLQVTDDNEGTTRVALLDTDTGAVVGDVLTFSGDSYGVVPVSPDGSQFLVYTYVLTGGTGSSATVSVVDAETGQQVGSSHGVVGYVDLTRPTYSPDGSRIVIVSADSSTTTSVTVLNSTTGEAVGAPIPLTGTATDVVLRPDGRALVTTGSGSTTTVTAVDLTDGQNAGSTSFDGTPKGGLRGTPTGDLALLTVSVHDTNTNTDSTKVVVIDVAGAPSVVDTLDLGGSPTGGVVLSADRTRAVQTGSAGSTTGATTSVSVINTSAYIDNPNTTPVVSRATSVNSPSGPVGTVTGTVYATDLDGDALTYGVTVEGLGTVSMNGSGRFIYIPSVEERSAAAATPGVDTETAFTVTVSDGRGGSVDIPVTVEIAPTGVVSEKSIAGSSGSATYLGDGSRALVTTVVGDQIVLSSFDTAANKQVGQPISVDGNLQNVTTSGSGTRAFITTTSYDGTSTTTRVVVVDTATGEQLGNTIVLVADPLSASDADGVVRFSQDGTRASISTSNKIVVIDTATGAPVGPAIDVVAGSALDVGRLNANGTRLTITTDTGVIQGVHAVEVHVYDTATGTPVGAPIAIDSDSSIQRPQFSADGSRAVVFAEMYDEPSDSATTQVKVIDVASGTQLGSTLTLNEFMSNYAVWLSADGSTATVSTYGYDRDTNTSTVHLRVIDTDTGSQLGTTAVVHVTGQGTAPTFNADGTRAILSGTTFDDQYVADTEIAVVDTTTGSEVGTTRHVAGFVDSIQLDSDGALAYVTTRDSSAGSSAVRVAIIDTGTGATQVLTYDLTPDQGLQVRVGPGAAVLTLATTYQSGGEGTTLVRSLDPATGAETGTSPAVPGYSVWDVQFNDDGSKAFVTTYSSATTGGPFGATSYTNHVVVVDTATGNRVGAPIALVGQLAPDGIQINDAGTRAAYTTYEFRPGGHTVTRVTIVDLTTGTQLGETITMAGLPAGTAHFTADDTGVVVSVSDDGSSGQTRRTLISVDSGAGKGGAGGGFGGVGFGGSGGHGGAGGSGLV